jgi:hypothetical protein
MQTSVNYPRTPRGSGPTILKRLQCPLYGRIGYANIADGCMQLTNFLQKKLRMNSKPSQINNVFFKHLQDKSTSRHARINGWVKSTATLLNPFRTDDHLIGKEEQETAT